MGCKGEGQVKSGTACYTVKAVEGGDCGAHKVGGPQTRLKNVSTVPIQVSCIVRIDKYSSSRATPQTQALPALSPLVGDDGTGQWDQFRDRNGNIAAVRQHQKTVVIGKKVFITSH